MKQIRDELEFWLAVSVQVREGNEITIVVGTRQWTCAVKD